MTPLNILAALTILLVASFKIGCALACLHF